MKGFIENKLLYIHQSRTILTLSLASYQSITLTDMQLREQNNTTSSIKLDIQWLPYLYIGIEVIGM